MANDSKPAVLLERLAEQIVEIVFGFDLVESADITVTKLRPPIPAHVESTSVTVSRLRRDVDVTPLRSTRAIVALGSNLGDRTRYLRDAVAGLGDVVGVSDVYETAPVGGPDEQGAFYNMVVAVDTPLDPFAFLRRCRRLETVALRQRVVHWGPRTLDVDVLFFGDISIESEELTVPHPRIDERRFVLEPLSDVAPQRCPDGWRERLPPADVVNVGPLDELCPPDQP